MPCNVCVVLRFLRLLVLVLAACSAGPRVAKPFCARWVPMLHAKSIGFCVGRARRLRGQDRFIEHAKSQTQKSMSSLRVSRVAKGTVSHPDEKLITFNAN